MSLVINKDDAGAFSFHINLSLSRASERRLLADLANQAVPSPENAANALGLARADALFAAVKSMDSLIEVTRVNEAGIKALEDLQ